MQWCLARAVVDEKRRAAVLDQQLAAAPARRERETVAGGHRDGDERPAATGDERRNEAALGAQRDAERGVLDVAAGVEVAVATQPSGADPQARIGRVGARGNSVGRRAKARPVDFVGTPRGTWVAHRPEHYTAARVPQPGLSPSREAGARPSVVVVGDVMVDVIVHQHRPLAIGSDTESSIRLAPGGSAANQAAHLATAGASVDFFGVVGEDGFGETAKRALEAVGVRPHLAIAPGCSSGVVVALVDAAGQRSMLTDRAANAELARVHLPERLYAPGHHLHLSGYELLYAASRPAALSLVARAKKAAMSISVDPCSAAPLMRAGATEFLSWTRGFAFCCANLDEAQVLSGERDPERAIESLARHYDEVTITLGEGGALWAARGEQLSLAARATEVRDTTGAGDAFTGTFLARRLSGDPPSDALSAGLEAAARAVATAGARPWR